MNINNNRLINVWIEYFYTLALTSIEVLVSFVKSLFGEDDVEDPPSFGEIFLKKVFGSGYFGPAELKKHFGITLSKDERIKSRYIWFKLFELFESRDRGDSVMFYVRMDPRRIIEYLNRRDNCPKVQAFLDLKGLELARSMDPCGWYLVPPISHIISVVQRDKGLQALPPSRTSQGIPSVISEVGVRPMSAWLAAYILLVDFVRVGHPTIGNQSFVTDTELVLPRRERDRGANGNPDSTLRVVVGPFVRAGLGPESPYVLTISMARLSDTLGTPGVASSDAVTSQS
jgi:hypothetical protein